MRKNPTTPKKNASGQPDKEHKDENATATGEYAAVTEQLVSMMQSMKANLEQSNEKWRKANEEQAAQSKTLAIATWILVVVGFLQFVILCIYANSTQSIAESTEKATGIGQKAADASSTNAKTAQDLTERSEAAYASYAGVELDPMVVGRPLSWTLQFQNGGKTPMTVTGQKISYALLPVGSKGNVQTPTPEVATYTLAPGQVVNVVGLEDHPLTADEMQQINSWKLRFYVLFSVTFTDVFDRAVKPKPVAFQYDPFKSAKIGKRVFSTVQLNNP